MKDYFYAEITEDIQACVLRTLVNICNGDFLQKAAS